jgi:hypothetical protein
MIHETYKYSRCLPHFDAMGLLYTLANEQEYNTMLVEIKENGFLLKEDKPITQGSSTIRKVSYEKGLFVVALYTENKEDADDTPKYHVGVYTRKR